MSVHTFSQYILPTSEINRAGTWQTSVWTENRGSEWLSHCPGVTRWSESSVRVESLSSFAGACWHVLLLAWPSPAHWLGMWHDLDALRRARKAWEFLSRPGYYSSPSNDHTCTLRLTVLISHMMSQFLFRPQASKQVPPLLELFSDSQPLNSTSVFYNSYNISL